MLIRSFKLKSFRNIPEIEIEPGEGINIIWGENAQGKTNILEAIWLFTGARSFRGALDKEMIMFGANAAELSMSIYEEERLQNAVIKITAQGRAAQYNGVELDSVVKFAGKIRAVQFSPEDLSLIKEGPARRRSFIDTAVTQLFPRQIVLGSQLRRVLLQRNTLLKDISRHAGLDGMLDIWDEKLASLSAMIINARLRYISKLNETARDIYHGISGGLERLSINYCSSAGVIGAGTPAGDIREIISAALKNNRKNDIRYGYSLIGPHRDDIDISLNDKKTGDFASQGQQRSCAIALKLAECAIIKDITDTQPLVLLDDVMSELDNRRRDYILNNITEKQVFITCCSDDYFKSVKEGKLFFIKGGRLEA